MTERMDVVTMKGKPLTLIGEGFKMGHVAPDAVLLDNDLKPVQISHYRGKIVVISTVTSLDTDVCDMQTRRFNSEAGKLSDRVVILTISSDLPFAQKRWCGAAGVDQVTILSDYREAAFGIAYGLLIKELRLLARSVLVLDDEGVIRYCQLVNEISEEPDYDAVIEAVRKLV